MPYHAEVWRLMQKEKRTQQVGANRHSCLFYSFFLFIVRDFTVFFKFSCFQRATSCKHHSAHQTAFLSQDLARLMRCKRTTWNEECLRKAVATIGKDGVLGCFGGTVFSRFVSNPGAILWIFLSQRWSYRFLAALHHPLC